MHVMGLERSGVPSDLPHTIQMLMSFHRDACAKHNNLHVESLACIHAFSACLSLSRH